MEKRSDFNLLKRVATGICRKPYLDPKLEALRILWTLYCDVYDQEVDTCTYDTELYDMWDAMESSGCNKVSFEDLDALMCQLLV